MICGSLLRRSWRCLSSLGDLDCKLKQLSLATQDLVQTIERIGHVVDEEDLSLEVNAIALRRPTAVALEQFSRVVPGSMVVASAQFLKKELPIRLAGRIVDLENLPSGLAYMPTIRAVREWYMQSFSKLRAAPMPQKSNIADFSKLLNDIYTKHTTVLPALAVGLAELRAAEIGNIDVDTPEGRANLLEFIRDSSSVDRKLDAMLLSRVGIRFLIGQHLEMVAQAQDTSFDKTFTGLVCRSTNPLSIAEKAVAYTRSLVSRYYRVVAPPVQIVTVGPLEPFLYVPGHIWFVLTEILKNSMHAMLLKANGGENIPTDGSAQVLSEEPIVVTMSTGGRGGRGADFVMKVADTAGGMRRSCADAAFSYQYTTGKLPTDLDDSAADTALETANHDCNAIMSEGAWWNGRVSPLTGYGYGLPVARLFSEYFGGGLEMATLEGSGTTVYVYLPMRNQIEHVTIPERWDALNI